MNYLCLFFLLFASLNIVCCSNSESLDASHPENENNSFESDSTDTPPKIEGMIYLNKGSLTLGSNDKSFKANERPAMKVELDYGFYMGIHEVTCGEYTAIAKKAKLKTFGNCQNDSLPLTDITYFDALLFTNAKSKSEAFDTVYTYNDATFDSEGHCTNLEGLKFHPDVDGFRLPTEAEWVYAAARDWNLKKAWFSENSNYELHNVCSLVKNESTGSSTTANEFCDLAGNAMEWVNDWLGAFRDTTITNYAGAPDGGDMGERVVKGGCYSSSKTEVNPYSRGDVYTVTSSTRANYVGFRLAFGTIPNPIWMNNNGLSIASVVTPLVSSEDIKSITGTYNVKLVFRNDLSGNISLLDFKNGTLAVEDITKGIEAYHPDISPDGKWVAFCTNFEGISGNSTLYVQKLGRDYTPTKLKVESAAIPRWRVTSSGDTAIVYVTSAGNNKDEAAFKAASTWQVTFAGGKFGTPEKLFDGAYHSGISEDQNLAVSGARLLRARVSGRDTTWYNGEQACNVSLARDSSKRTAFLDFGGKTGREFVGNSYSTHQRILVADSTGKLIKSYGAPSGYTFDHSEWASNGSNSLIVAALTNANGAHTKIAIINPADSSITEIAEGEELWHPNLWIKKVPKTIPSTEDSTEVDTTFHLDPDSAGVYYISGASDKALIMRYKMELLWQYKDSANTVILGSSRPKNSLIPEELSNQFFAINLASSYFSINESHYTYFNYIQSNVKKLKHLIVSLDIDMWWKSYNSYKNFFYKDHLKIPGYVYDKNHLFGKDFDSQELYRFTYESIGSNYYAKIFRSSRGYHKFDNSIGWENDPPLYHDSTWMQDTISLYENSIKLLKEIILDSKEKDIFVIGIIFPQSPAYKNTGSFGCYGLQRSLAPSVIDDLTNLSQENPNFILMDENKMGNHDYTDEMARDRDHLSHTGALQITHRLDSLLRTLE